MTDLTETPRPTLEELLAREVDAAEAERDWRRDEAGLAGCDKVTDDRSAT